MIEFIFKGPFQSHHTETTHIPTMDDHEPKFGEHSRDQEQPRNDRQKTPLLMMKMRKRSK